MELDGAKEKTEKRVKLQHMIKKATQWKMRSEPAQQPEAIEPARPAAGVPDGRRKGFVIQGGTEGKSEAVWR